MVSGRVCGLRCCRDPMFVVPLLHFELHVRAVRRTTRHLTYEKTFVESLTGSDELIMTYMHYQQGGPGCRLPLARAPPHTQSAAARRHAHKAS